jgi:hypothetical protein
MAARSHLLPSMMPGDDAAPSSKPEGPRRQATRARPFERPELAQHPTLSVSKDRLRIEALTALAQMKGDAAFTGLKEARSASQTVRHEAIG